MSVRGRWRLSTRAKLGSVAKWKRRQVSTPQFPFIRLVFFLFMNLHACHPNFSLERVNQLCSVSIVRASPPAVVCYDILAAPLACNGRVGINSFYPTESKSTFALRHHRPLSPVAENRMDECQQPGSVRPNETKCRPFHPGSTWINVQNFELQWSLSHLASDKTPNHWRRRSLVEVCWPLVALMTLIAT